MSKYDDAMPKLKALALSSDSGIVPDVYIGDIQYARALAQLLEAQAKVRLVALMVLNEKRGVCFAAWRSACFSWDGALVHLTRRKLTAVPLSCPQAGALTHSTATVETAEIRTLQARVDTHTAKRVEPWTKDTPQFRKALHHALGKDKRVLEGKIGRATVAIAALSSTPVLVTGKETQKSAKARANHWAAVQRDYDRWYMSSISACACACVCVCACVRTAPNIAYLRPPNAILS